MAFAAISKALTAIPAGLFSLNDDAGAGALRAGVGTAAFAVLTGDRE